MFVFWSYYFWHIFANLLENPVHEIYYILNPAEKNF